MAKVTMDDSEYELLKENKRLLEEALSETKRQQAEIDRLNKEKLEILENSKMKVTKVTRLETYESVWIDQPEVFALEQLNRNLTRHFNSYGTNVSFKSVKSVIDTFFKRVVTTSDPKIEITTLGLDEVRKEIREELQSKIDSDIKDKLANADKALEAYSILSKTVDDLREENYNLSKYNSDLIDHNVKLKDAESNLSKLESKYQRNLDLLTKYTYLCKEILKATPETVSSFGNKEIVKKVKRLIETTRTWKNLF